MSQGDKKLNVWTKPLGQKFLFYMLFEDVLQMLSYPPLCGSIV